MKDFRDKMAKVRQSLAVTKVRSSLAILAENTHFRARNLYKDKL